MVTVLPLGALLLPSGLCESNRSAEDHGKTLRDLHLEAGLLQDLPGLVDVLARDVRHEDERRALGDDQVDRVAAVDRARVRATAR